MTIVLYSPYNRAVCVSLPVAGIIVELSGKFIVCVVCFTCPTLGFSVKL